MHPVYGAVQHPHLNPFTHPSIPHVKMGYSSLFRSSLFQRVIIPKVRYSEGFDSLKIT